LKVQIFKTAKQQLIMKKIASVFCFFIFLSGVLPAQGGAEFRFGFQTSPTWAWMRTSEKRKLEGVGSNWGLKLGMLGEYYFAPNYAIISGLGFGFNQGGNLQVGDYESANLWPKSEDAPFLESQAKFHYRLNYVEIPFGLKMRGGSNEDARIKFYAEIPVFTIGFVTRAQGDTRGSKDNDNNINDLDIRDDVRGLSLAWGLGGGIEYELATSATLVAGLAFQQQFTDVTKDGSVIDDGVEKKEDSKGSIGMIALKMGIFF
jgi:hypothetical protein